MQPKAPDDAGGTIPMDARKKRVLLALALMSLFLLIGSPFLIAMLLLLPGPRTYYIPTHSMEPALQKGKTYWGDGRAYLKAGPQRGDIAVFKYPENPRMDYIKRVIGLPGEQVEIRAGQVFIDGRELLEPYEHEKFSEEFGPVRVPADQYFVLGDNREHSSDSREWGCVERKAFVSRIRRGPDYAGL